ncbi:MAG TPA: YceI family protein [Terriglobales bacterium]|nr:YceI family protein [Terriglobales bacterium]
MEGSFLLKYGAIRFNPATDKASREVVFDASSGKTGNSSRDNKMHKDVIQSRRYPEIVFHPDRADGTLSTYGDSGSRGSVGRNQVCQTHILYN